MPPGAAVSATDGRTVLAAEAEEGRSSGATAETGVGLVAGTTASRAGRVRLFGSVRVRATLRP